MTRAPCDPTRDRHGAPDVRPVDVLGYPVAPMTLDAAADAVLRMAGGSTPRRVVTLNPEIVVRAERDPELADAIATADLVVADGVGIVWAARRSGTRLPGRVPGADLVEEVLRRGGPELSVFFLGGRPGVAERAAEVAAARYGAHVAGAAHGFFRGEREESELVARIRQARPQLLLAGLGERQEVFLAEQLERLRVPAAVGVGGTLDVLAGVARRTPRWTRSLGIEWAWRVGLDPKRWHRVPRLVRFAALVLARRERRSTAR